MRSFFVAERNRRASGQFAQFQHMLHDAVVGSPEYSHFVTWLDIANRTWTIDKVFLNDILPAGNGYGAKAVAEHLLAPPELLSFSERDISTKVIYRNFD
ncbi:Sirt3 [Symbiodinium pilosum]|uniref:Sirt3 protein n=1 Tax=Symbiodinium pilosum TaxID=2952 RepID=A0A812XV89_SYMPI|nr:Sirt3 [Symbiodinium pilosum]